MCSYSVVKFSGLLRNSVNFSWQISSCYIIKQSQVALQKTGYECGFRRNFRVLSWSSLQKNRIAADIGDLKEEKHLSFTPIDKKTGVQLQNEILHFLGNNKLKEALQLFEVKRKEEHVKLSREMFVILIGACGRAGYTKKAFSLYNDMKKCGWSASISTFTALFNACANSPWRDDGLQRALKLKEQINNQGVILNSIVYHAMIKAFGRAGEFTSVIEVVKEMEMKGIPLTTETFNIALQSCISFPTDGFLRAMFVWRKMHDLNIQPDLFSYNLLLRSVRDCGVGDVEKTLSTLPIDFLACRQSPSLQENHANETTSLPSLTYHNIFVDIMESSRFIDLLQTGDLSQNRISLFGGIEGFFKKMEKDRVLPDIKTISLMLDTASFDSQQEKVIVEYAEKVGINFDIDFINLLIKRRNMRKDSFGVKEAINLIQKKKLHPNIMTFGVLAIGCRSIQQAKLFFADMENAGYRINVEIFGSLLSTAAVSNNCEYLIYLMNRAVEWNLTIDEKALKTLEDFKSKTMKCIGSQDRKEEVNAIYGQERFRNSFRLFCLNYERWLKELSIGLKPHPWDQYRYPIH